MQPPFISCEKHGKVRGYRVCVHVWKDKEEPKVILAPNESQRLLGLLSCGHEICFVAGKDKGDVVTCEKCLLENKFIFEENLKGIDKVRSDIAPKFGIKE